MCIRDSDNGLDKTNDNTICMHRDQEIGEHLYAGLINHQPVLNYFAIKIALCLEKKSISC